jgi:hypothetical protein
MQKYALFILPIDGNTQDIGLLLTENGIHSSERREIERKH